MNVNDYYDKVALNYNEKFSKGILGYLRRKERKVVFEFLDSKTNELILDAGCGSGFDARPLLEKGCDVYGVDISEGMVKMACNSGLKAQVGELESFWFQFEFDKIMSCGVMEFCKNHSIIFQNFNNHLKKDGFAVIHFPYFGFVGIIYFFYHLILNRIRIKLFTYNKMRRIAEESGFNVLMIKKAHSFIAVMKIQKK